MSDDIFSSDHELKSEGQVKNITLTREDARKIQEIIADNYDFSNNQYCAKVGIRPSNFYNVMNGKRPCSTEFLNKLLSGVGYQVTVTQTLSVQKLETGQTVDNANFTLLDDE